MILYNIYCKVSFLSTQKPSLYVVVFFIYVVVFFILVKKLWLIDIKMGYLVVI